MESSRCKKMVEMALAKARLIHEAYAECDAKGGTPILSTVLNEINEKLNLAETDNRLISSKLHCSSAPDKVDDMRGATMLLKDKDKTCDEDYIPYPDSDSSFSTDDELPLKYLATKVKTDKLKNKTEDDTDTDTITNNSFPENVQSNLNAVLLTDIQTTLFSASNDPNILEKQIESTTENETPTDDTPNLVFPEKVHTGSTEVLADTEPKLHPTNTHGNTKVQVEDHNDPNTSEPVKKKRKLTKPDEKEIRDRNKHPMHERACSTKCKSKQCSVITDEDRQIIWDQFWKLPYSMRRQWLCRNVRICHVSRGTVQPKQQTLPSQDSKNSDEDAEVVEKKRSFLKNESREYSLPKPTLENQQVRVCKKKLQDTLGYTNDSVITELSSAIKKSTIGQTVAENRGKCGPGNKIDRKVIMNHIESFGPSISHYRRYNAPNCRYLSRDLTVRIMYEDFITKNPGFCQMETYRTTLKSMNISLKMPKGDRCGECLLFELQIDEYTKRNEVVDPDVLSKKELHELKANQAKTLYKEDKNRKQGLNERIYSMDLQKVILLPIMPKIKESLFLSRLVVYNETFAVLNTKSSYQSVAVLWHEVLQGRNADSIVDSILSIISKENSATSFVFWADNCTAQNKNWILYSSLVQIVNQATGPEKITIRYFTKGHTHMSADSVHGNIEKSMKAAITINNFDQLVKIIEKCRKNLSVEKQEVFREWKSKKRVNQKKYVGSENSVEPTLVNNVLLHEMVEVKFVKGNRDLLYKTDFQVT